MSDKYFILFNYAVFFWGFYYSGVKEDSFFLMTFCVSLRLSHVSFFLLVMQNLCTLTLFFLYIIHAAKLVIAVSLAGFFSIWSSWRCLPHAWWIKAESWCVLEFCSHDHLGFDEWFLFLFLLLQYIIKNCIF